MVDERCAVTGLIVQQCAHCLSAPGRWLPADSEEVFVCTECDTLITGGMPVFRRTNGDVACGRCV